jgi:hypothetical protein
VFARGEEVFDGESVLGAPGRGAHVGARRTRETTHA